jgi:hypothetical protein
MEDFLEYDFIGAPIDPDLGFGEGFNGGLSLRNRSLMLDIVTTWNWKAEKEVGDNENDPRFKFEDQVRDFRQ